MEAQGWAQVTGSLVGVMGVGERDQSCREEVSFSARKRNYLGASNAISTRETTASRSTLQAEKKRSVSLITTPGTGQALKAEKERHGGLTRSPGGPGRPVGPGSPRAPRFPSSPAGPGGP